MEAEVVDLLLCGEVLKFTDDFERISMDVFVGGMVFEEEGCGY